MFIDNGFYSVTQTYRRCVCAIKTEITKIKLQIVIIYI